MSADEQALVIGCAREELVGVWHPGDDRCRVALVVVVGGPQYRVGSHRQFVLLARDLAGRGVPVLRFDYRGKGDSGSGSIEFDQTAEDIRAAVDRCFLLRPDLQGVVLWGLCDGASAAALYGHGDPRVKGMVMLNPWVRTEGGMARAYVRNYYGRRLLSRDMWRKVIAGRWNPVESIGSFLGLLYKGFLRGGASGQGPGGLDRDRPLPERMLQGLERYRGRLLLVLSGDQDYVAAEFRELVAGEGRWQRALASPRTEWRSLGDANHTFSRREWRDQVAEWTHAWMVERLGAGGAGAP